MRSLSHTHSAVPTAETCLTHGVEGTVALFQETSPITGSAAGEGGRRKTVQL